jgi:hypothetical protein
MASLKKIILLAILLALVLSQGNRKPARKNTQQRQNNQAKAKPKPAAQNTAK